MNTPVAAALRCSLMFLVSAVAYADSAQWNLNPTSGDWNTIANWRPIGVPNGPADMATFALSNTTNVSISQDTEVNGITFTSAATNPYSIEVNSGLTLTLSGTGITNNSGIAQFLYCDQLGDEGGQILFTNSASAGNAAITSYGVLQFSNNSTAGSADIENGGDILFSNGATAGSANILNFSLGETEFSDSSTAGDATIDGYDTSFIEFFDTSTAGSATIQSLGEITFYDSSDGGTARIWIHEFFPVPESGVLDISRHNAPGVTIGSIEDDGYVLLGANNLTVGSNNLNTTFSGVILDGAFVTSLTRVATGAVDFTAASSYDGRPRLDSGLSGDSDSTSSNTLLIQDRGLTGSTGGSLTKIGSGTLDLEGANTYTGDTNINRGGLQVDGSISSNTFVNRGGTLAGSGTVNGNITNRGGKISPGGAIGVPGVLTVGGNYTTWANRIAGGTLSIQIGGGNVGQVSVLDVQGNANLGGFLDPVLVSGFVPEIGQSFTFLNFASFTGFFHIRRPVFDHGRKRWSVAYSPTSAALIVEDNHHP
jgi:autotransporter-associated beta strand protein